MLQDELTTAVFPVGKTHGFFLRNFSFELNVLRSPRIIYLGRASTIENLRFVLLTLLDEGREGDRRTEAKLVCIRGRGKA